MKDLERGLNELSEAEAQVDTEANTHLSLERLEGGSLMLGFTDPTSPKRLEDLAQQTARCLTNFRLLNRTSSPRIVETLRRFNHRHHCRTQIFRKYDDPEPLVEFSEAAPPARPDLIEETTSFFGVLERVGGTAPRAWIRQHSGDRIICRLPEDRILAKELAQHLYKEVGLSGRAIRDLQNDELVELFVEELTYVETPAPESFEKLREVIGPYWSDIDVMAVIREERGSYGD